MSTLDSYYFGMIQNVWPPDHVDNSGKYQTEYEVLVTADGYAAIPTRCIREDRFGGQDSFEDIIMAVGDKVMIKFPRGDRSCGVIQHGTRAYVAPQNPAMGQYWMNRFNKVVRYIDKDGNYSVTSDSGPTLQVNTNKIVLDDSTGESIIIDKEAATLTINAKTWQVNIQGDATIAVTGDTTLTTNKLTATCQGKAVIQAESVEVQGSNGQVLTTMTDPVVDSIFGEPTMGVETFKAGS